MFDINKGAGYVSAIGGTWKRSPTGIPVIYRVKEARRTPYEYSHRFSDLWALDYFFQPGVTVQVSTRDGATWKRDTATAHLYPPGTRYWERAESGIGPIHSCWVLFHGGEHAGLSRLIHPRLGFGRIYDPLHRLVDQMQALAREGQMFEDQGFWRVQGKFLNLIDLLGSARTLEPGLHEIPADERSPQVHPMVVGVISYLQQHLAEPIRVSDLARNQRVSVSVLAHRYRDVMGEGPIKTLTRMRIQFAKELLVQGEKLKTIADKCGFCNEYHISKVFKKLEGSSPRAFLKGAKTKTV